MEARKITVAIIDDYTPLRNRLCAFLEKMGMAVLFQADNGEDGLQKIAASGQQPDVCLLDTSMPVMDGFATAETLHDKYPNLKILAYSVSNDVHSIIKMFQCGADGYAIKGEEPDDLKQAIELLYSGGCYFSDGVQKVMLDYFRKQERSY